MQLTLLAIAFAPLAIAGPINPYEVRTAIKSTPSMPYGQGIDLLTTPTVVVVKREEAIEPPQADAKEADYGFMLYPAIENDVPMTFRASEMEDVSGEDKGLLQACFFPALYKRVMKSDDEAEHVIICKAKVAIAP
ncbi:hypothetical protein D6C93_03812 [Aureobasidium pullulans]|nr:hypothetical protein D6C93_03812 [Aureobasidium pullulans]